MQWINTIKMERFILSLGLVSFVIVACNDVSYDILYLTFLPVLFRPFLSLKIITKTFSKERRTYCPLYSSLALLSPTPFHVMCKSVVHDHYKYMLPNLSLLFKILVQSNISGPSSCRDLSTMNSLLGNGL
jgi:hypothetical protein